MKEEQDWHTEDVEDANVQSRPGDEGKNQAPCTAAPDGGWGWMIVLGAIFVQLAFSLVTRSFGVIYIEFLKQYGETPSVTGGVGALSITCSGLFGPLASSLAARYSCRSVAIVGSLLMTLGFIFTGYSPNIISCYFAFGILVGGGLSLVYTVSNIIISQYFVRRRGIAMGVVSTGSNVGALVFPPAMVALLDYYGYAGACLIFGGACLHCCIGGSLFRPLSYRNKSAKMADKMAANKNHSNDEQNHRDESEQFVSDSNKEVSPANGFEVRHQNRLSEKESGHTEVALLSDFDSDNKQNGVNSVDKKVEPSNSELSSNGSALATTVVPSEQEERRRKPPLFDKQLFGDATFIGLLCLLTAMAFNLALDATYLPVFAVEKGVSLKKAAFLVSISGLTSMIGSPLMGVLIDMKRIKPYRLSIYTGLNILVGFAALAQPLAGSYEAIVVVVVIRAFLVGVVMSQRITMSGDIVGQQKTASAFGMCMLVHALGSMLGRALGGILKDALGNYGIIFYIGGTVQLMGVSILVFTLISKRWRRKK